MAEKTRVFFLSLTIFALLVFSAVGTVPVYADDGTSTGSSETSAPTTDTSQGGSPSDGQTDTTGTVPTDAPAVDPVQPAAAPLLEQLPENTTVTVIGPEGEAQPLASQDSVTALLLSDPIWCPSNQTTPTPGDNGCTGSYGSFTELLDFLKANEENYQKDGTIFVQQGAYLGGETSIDFNAYGFQKINQHNLTITGGWNTADNSVNTSGTQFTAPIIIGSSGNPWAGTLTLNNIFINGVANQAGLTLYSTKDIELSNVQVTESQSGANLNANGKVTVKNSKFNKNKTAGAVVQAGNDVKITLSEFTDNASYVFQNPWLHYGTGLQVTTTGNLSLDGVTADRNLVAGATLDAATVEILNSTFSDNKSSYAEDTAGYGLKVKSSNKVTLQSVAANNNQFFGADIDSASSVIVKQSFFNGNSSYTYISDVKTFDGYGLRIVTPADIGLNTVAADGNYLYGAHLEGSDVVVNNGSFSNNGSGWVLDMIGRGLEVVARQNTSFGNGDVSLNNITADNNQLFGANIQSNGQVAISADTGKFSSFSGHISYYYLYGTNTVADITGGYGLQITYVPPVAGQPSAFAGNIALQNVITNNNYLYGTFLDGNNIAISNSFFSHNGSGVLTKPVGSDMGYGLKIKSKGSKGVALRQVEANYNQLYGADIWAQNDVIISTPTTLDPQDQTYSNFSRNQSVIVSPSNVAFFGYGLSVYSAAGDITLNHVIGNYNNLWGASLDGMSVFIDNSQFNNNVSDSNTFIDDTGLIVNSRGDFVSLNNVEARENRLIGAEIKSVYGGVYITNSRFNDNAGFTCTLNWCPPESIVYHGYGLQVTTPGIISLDTVTANGNNLFGANLSGSEVSVVNSTFNNNRFGNGLAVTTTGTANPANNAGNVTLTNVTASGNGQNGVDVTTQDPCAQVRLTGGTFTNNSQYGLSVVGGSITFGGTQTFGGNGAEDLFHDPAICVIPPVAAAPLNNNAGVVQTESANTNALNTVAPTVPATTTLSNSSNSSTSITTNEKTSKGKKADKHGHKSLKVKHAKHKKHR